MSPRGLAVVAATLLLGCTRPGSDARGVGLEVPAVAGSAPGPPAAAAKETCSVPEPRGVPVPYGHLLHSAEVGFHSYYLAEDARQGSVLLQLGRSGELVATPVPARTANVARESASRLRFLADGQPPRWFTADLSNPDAPLVSPAMEARGVEHKGTLKAFVSDGERALVGRYMVDYDKQPTRYYGETALHSVPDGKRTSPVLPVTAWSGACRAKRCVAAASGEGVSVPIELLGIQDSGSERLAQLDEQCAGWADWVDGDSWVVARPSKPGLELFAIDLSTWRVTKKRVSNSLECPWVQHAELGGRRGVLYGARAGELSFLPVSEALVVGEPESLPKAAQNEQLLAPMADGALLLEQEIGHGMLHSPTDGSGMRRYYRVWSFDGRAALLRPDARSHSWRAEAFARLPHSGEQGEHSDGYRGRPLVRPGFAAVLVDDRPGGKSELLVVGRPCGRQMSDH